MSNADQKSPAEKRAERFEELCSEWDRLSSRVTLGHLRDEIEDVTGQIEALPHRIDELAGRGYHYSQDWEARAETLSEGWPERRREALDVLRDEVPRLDDLGQEIERLCGRSVLADRALDRLEHNLDRLESQLDTAERDVRGLYDSVQEPLRQLESEFDAVEFMLDALDTASFDLQPDEHGVAAGEAVWTNHPDEPEGILFLTDDRLLFEQREKKATKKILFITTESELVQEKLWESTVANVAELEAEDEKKFLGHKELLHLRFHEYTSGLHGEVTLRLEDTTNEVWASLLKFVQGGQLDSAPAAPETADPAEATPVEPAGEAPTHCPACGGRLSPPAPGARTIVCDYCGTSIDV